MGLPGLLAWIHLDYGRAASAICGLPQALSAQRYLRGHPH